MKTLNIENKNIIPTNINYSYSILTINISALKKIYPFIEVINIGKSVLKKNIPVIKVGTGKKELFYLGAFHANEWITSLLLMKFLENYCFAITNNTNLYNYNARKIFNNTTLYICPMVNPDGVNLVTKEPIPNKAFYHALNIAKKYPSITFPSGWKANIEGVDLNLQFPANWEKAKKIKFDQKYTKPAPRDYVGIHPLSSPEALAIYNFTIQHNFSLIITYHTQGKEIYWNYQNYASKYAKHIGYIFSKISGYKLTDVPYNSSFAGYKDWFIEKYKIPAYTIEAGYGTNPLPISQFNEIYNDNIGILTLGMIL